MFSTSTGAMIDKYQNWRADHILKQHVDRDGSCRVSENPQKHMHMKQSGFEGHADC